MKNNNKLNIKKILIYLIPFLLILILFAVFSTQIIFHDTTEYITLSKYLAGTNNVNIFTSHSIIYPFIISFLLKIWPSLTTIKLINTFWIFLIGLTFLLLKNKKAFIIFAFSPLTWITSIQTTPILPASFFFLLSFILFKKKFPYHLLISGLLLGLSFATYTPMILVSFFFILIYFWNKNFKDFIIYIIAFSIGFLPRMILDYYYFNMPFYSLIRFFGTNVVILLGQHIQTAPVQLFLNIDSLLIFIAISPLLFKIYKLNTRKYKQEIIFLTIIFLIILIRASLLKYFIIISPIIILLLVKVYNNKDIKWHCILSILLIIFLTSNYFITTNNLNSINENNLDNLIQNDLNQIATDYNNQYIIAGPFEATKFAQFIWKEKPYFIWFQEYQASINNQSTIREYHLNFNSNIPLKNQLQISAYFNRYDNKTYNNEDLILVTQKSKEEFPELNNFNLDKCYDVLCVYQK
tara:strand:+ start:1428 stop:2822 length:1395 start_codon:yes stop_codon:yes gene_type:complete